MKKLLTDFFRSGSERQRNKKRLTAMVLCATAALLVVALLTLSIVSLATAIKGKAPAGDDEQESGAKIPSGYTALTSFEGVKTVDDLLLPIDAEHPYVNPNATVQPSPENRAKTDGGADIYKGDYSLINLTQDTMDALNKMMLDFYAASKDNAEYELGKIWLSHANTAETPLSTATKAVLQSGFAVILEYQHDGTSSTIFDKEANKGVGVYDWFFKNAASYGFVQASAVEGEENVFRYVGAAHATYMKAQNKTLSEYLTLLQGRGYRSPLSISVKADGATKGYSVYYLSAEELVVPEKYAYTVSRDGAGGYIITVDKSAKTN